MIRRVAACVALALAVGCSATERIAQQDLQPAIDGQLTVAAALPSPGFWEGDDVDHLTGGFEREIAAALAARFDLELVVVDVAFDQIAAGDLGGADLALSQIAVSDARSEALDFSVPYYRDDAGVVARPDHELPDMKSARESSWVVVRGTTHETFLHDVVEPDSPTLTVADDVAAVDAVRAGLADAALVDLASALVLDGDGDGVVTVARFDIDQLIAAALPPGSANVEAVDAALRALASDGTLDELEREWLVPRFGTDPDSIPAIRFR